ncbi:MAG: 3-oxoacyl-[acyl-carrier-protein] reductase [Gammaproteobacteria bacterium]
MKKALVTGATRGIGKAISKSLKLEGFEVIGTATSSKGVNLLKEEGIIGFELDLNCNQSTNKFIESIKEDHKDITVLVNNAGITRDNIVLRMSDDEWSDILNIHLTGMFKLSKNILKGMLKNRWGRIINITSASASLGNRGQSNYAAAKAGVEAFSRSLSKEVGSRGITVNCIAPGFIETDMTSSIDEKAKKILIDQIPLGRFGKPEEISQMVNYLVSDQGSYITGQTLHINGGLYM